MILSKWSLYDNLTRPVQEAYKVLRESIRFCKSEKNIKTITILSTNPNEGKTSISLNLAISMSKSGAKVLLIDADLKKPKPIGVFGSPESFGIIDFILGGSSFNRIITNTGVENLYFISSGEYTKDSSELIISPKFKELLQLAKNNFDYVIVDTPAAGTVVDGIAVASQTDGAILVIEAGAVDRQAVIRVKKQLVNSNIKILGVVLNKVSKADYKKHYENYNYFFDKKNFMESSSRANRRSKRSSKGVITQTS
jgi:capsular exopolysaccharide synthesis family protein